MGRREKAPGAQPPSGQQDFPVESSDEETANMAATQNPTPPAPASSPPEPANAPPALPALASVVATDSTNARISAAGAAAPIDGRKGNSDEPGACLAIPEFGLPGGGLGCGMEEGVFTDSGACPATTDATLDVEDDNLPGHPIGISQQIPGMKTKPNSTASSVASATLPSSTSRRDAPRPAEAEKPTRADSNGQEGLSEVMKSGSFIIESRRHPANFVWVPKSTEFGPEQVDKIRRHWKLPAPSLLLRFESGFAHPRHMLTYQAMDKTRKLTPVYMKNSNQLESDYKQLIEAYIQRHGEDISRQYPITMDGTSAMGMLDIIDRMNTLLLFEAERVTDPDAVGEMVPKPGGRAAGFLDAASKTKKDKQRTVELNGILHRQLVNMVRMVLNIAVEDDVWIVLKGYSTGLNVIVESVLEDCNPRPVVLVVDNPGKPRYINFDTQCSFFLRRQQDTLEEKLGEDRVEGTWLTITQMIERYGECIVRGEKDSNLHSNMRSQLRETVEPVALANKLKMRWRSSRTDFEFRAVLREGIPLDTSAAERTDEEQGSWTWDVTAEGPEGVPLKFEPFEPVTVTSSWPHLIYLEITETWLEPKIEDIGAEKLHPDGDRIWRHPDGRIGKLEVSVTAFQSNSGGRAGKSAVSSIELGAQSQHSIEISKLETWIFQMDAPREYQGVMDELVWNRDEKGNEFKFSIKDQLAVRYLLDWRAMNIRWVVKDNTTRAKQMLRYLKDPESLDHLEIPSQYPPISLSDIWKRKADKKGWLKQLMSKTSKGKTDEKFVSQLASDNGWLQQSQSDVGAEEVSWCQFMFGSGTHYILLQDDSTSDFKLDAFGPVGNLFAGGGESTMQEMLRSLRGGEPTLLLDKTGRATQMVAALHAELIAHFYGRDMPHIDAVLGDDDKQDPLKQTSCIPEAQLVEFCKQWADAKMEDVMELFHLYMHRYQTMSLTCVLLNPLDMEYNERHFLTAIARCFSSARCISSSVADEQASQRAVANAWQLHYQLSISCYWQKLWADICAYMTLVLSLMSVLVSLALVVYKNKDEDWFLSDIWKNGTLKYAVIILPALNGLVSTVNSRMKFMMKWGIMKTAAGLIEQEIFKFRTKVEGYAIVNTGKNSSGTSNSSRQAREQYVRKRFSTKVLDIFRNHLEGIGDAHVSQVPDDSDGDFTQQIKSYARTAAVLSVSQDWNVATRQNTWAKKLRTQSKNRRVVGPQLGKRAQGTGSKQKQKQGTIVEDTGEDKSSQDEPGTQTSGCCCCKRAEKTSSSKFRLKLDKLEKKDLPKVDKAIEKRAAQVKRIFAVEQRTRAILYEQRHDDVHPLRECMRSVAYQEHEEGKRFYDKANLNSKGILSLADKVMHAKINNMEVDEGHEDELGFLKAETYYQTRLLPQLDTLTEQSRQLTRKISIMECLVAAFASLGAILGASDRPTEVTVCVSVAASLASLMVQRGWTNRLQTTNAAVRTLSQLHMRWTSVGPIEQAKLSLITEMVEETETARLRVIGAWCGGVSAVQLGDRRDPNASSPEQGGAGNVTINMQPQRPTAGARQRGSTNDSFGQSHRVLAHE